MTQTKILNREDDQTINHPSVTHNALQLWADGVTTNSQLSVKPGGSRLPRQPGTHTHTQHQTVEELDYFTLNKQCLVSRGLIRTFHNKSFSSGSQTETNTQLQQLPVETTQVYIQSNSLCDSLSSNKHIHIFPSSWNINYFKSSVVVFMLTNLHSSSFSPSLLVCCCLSLDCIVSLLSVLTHFCAGFWLAFIVVTYGIPAVRLNVRFEGRAQTAAPSGEVWKHTLYWYKSVKLRSHKHHKDSFDLWPQQWVVVIVK